MKIGHTEKGEAMGRPRMIGKFKPYTPNNRADMRRVKQYRRSREYTERHEVVLEESREKRIFREKEEMGC